MTGINKNHCSFFPLCPRMWIWLHCHYISYTAKPIICTVLVLSINGGNMYSLYILKKMVTITHQFGMIIGLQICIIASLIMKLWTIGGKWEQWVCILANWSLLTKMITMIFCMVWWRKNNNIRKQRSHQHIKRQWNRVIPCAFQSDYKSWDRSVSIYDIYNNLILVI